jgi:hypothetical protein
LSIFVWWIIAFFLKHPGELVDIFHLKKYGRENDKNKQERTGYSFDGASSYLHRYNDVYPITGEKRMMKQIGITCILLVACLYLGGMTHAEAVPQIEFVDGVTFDFGDVQPNSTVTHTFVFTNPGDEVLNIVQVKGG